MTGMESEEAFPVYVDCDIGLDTDLINENVEELSDDCDYSSQEDVIDSNMANCIGEVQEAMREAQLMGMQMTMVMLRNSDIHIRCAQPHLYDRLGQLKYKDPNTLYDLDTPFKNEYDGNA